MSKIRTEVQPAPEHTRKTEFEHKVAAGAKAAQVHGAVVQHSYESALNVKADDAADAKDSDARGTEVGAPEDRTDVENGPSLDR